MAIKLCFLTQINKAFLNVRKRGEKRPLLEDSESRRIQTNKHTFPILTHIYIFDNVSLQSPAFTRTIIRRSFVFVIFLKTFAG